MGLNFYKRRGLTEEEKNAIIAAVEDGRLLSARWYGECGEDGFLHMEEIEERDLSVHIGKSSAGWQFLFDHNDWRHFGKSEEEMRAWIDDPSKGRIEDETGEVISPADFWNKVESKRDGLDGEAYLARKRASGEQVSWDDYDTDFYVGNLRVANFTDFS